MLVVDLLVFGPGDCVSGFLVASGLCCAGARCVSEGGWSSPSDAGALEGDVG